RPWEPVTEEVEFEAAEIEEALEEPGESVRQTEPFPIKPAEGGGDWDFLKKKKGSGADLPFCREQPHHARSAICIDCAPVPRRAGRLHHSRRADRHHRRQ